MKNDNKYNYLIQLIEATPKAPVPDNFTQNVMERIALVNPSEAGVQYRWAQMLTVSNIRECSFCFFITGFFYLIIGIVLMAGFKAIGSGIAVTDWIALQPRFTIGAALWLLALGLLLIMDGKIGIKIAQYGTLLYIFFTVANGILIRQYIHVPYAGVFISGFIGTGAFMGIMLSLAVQKVELRTV